MPSYDQITDEEELHKMMSNTDDFDERKKLRARLREIRDKQREDMEAKKKERAASSQDAVKLKFQMQEDQKKLQMEGFAKQAVKTSTITESKTGPGGETKSTTTTTTEASKSLPGGGTRLVIQKKTETTVQSKGLGSSMGKPAAPMDAFKKMDNAAGGGAAKPKMMARSPSAIKQVLLDWTKAMTQGYPNVEVTNFSSSWNTGMAFCALIHHFYPDAFDFSKLNPKARRFNFTLAFDIAEKKADIAPLLDVDDMVKMKNPDWKCVFTYVQSIYRHLRDHENNKVMPCPVAVAEQ